MSSVDSLQHEVLWGLEPAVIPASPWALARRRSNTKRKTFIEKAIGGLLVCLFWCADLPGPEGPSAVAGIPE